MGRLSPDSHDTKNKQELPWRSSNARDLGSLPGRGTKIPYALGQPSPCAGNRGAHLSKRRPSTDKLLKLGELFKI